MKPNIIVNGVKFQHGDSITCTILHKHIEDAKIAIIDAEALEIYICQNVFPGVNTPDKLGYKYSYFFIKSGENMKSVKKINNKIIPNVSLLNPRSETIINKRKIPKI